MAAAACGQEVIVQVWPHAGSQRLAVVSRIGSTFCHII